MSITGIRTIWTDARRQYGTIAASLPPSLPVLAFTTITRS